MNNKVFSNAIWIIGCKIIKSVLALIVGMLTARYLGPSKFGLINYAASLVAFASPIMLLGLSNTLVCEIIDNEENHGEVIGTAMFMSVVSGIMCVIGLVAFVYVANPGESEAFLVCSIYSVILIMQAIELLQYWFQARLLSKYTSLAMLLSYCITTIYKIFLLVCNKSIYWFAFANALDVLIIDILIICLYNKYSNNRLSISKNMILKLFKNSKHYILADMLVVIFAETDKVMIKMMISNEATGYYAAAVSICGMTGFVFVAIIDSARPVIFDAKKSTASNYENNIVKLYSVIIYMAMAQSCFVSFLAKPIINIIYGHDFLPATIALRIVVWYTTFAYIGGIRNIWILAEEKQHLLWKINLSGAVANVFMNLVMIPMWGIEGAAMASLITQFFTNVCTGFMFKEISYNNTLILKSLDFRWCISFCKKYLVKETYKM